MKAAEITSREVEIQHLKAEYLKDFKRELRTIITTCYTHIKATDYGIAPEKTQKTEVSRALETLKDFLDVGTIAISLTGVGVVARPYIGGVSFGVGKTKTHLERMERERGQKNLKIFVKTVEKSMNGSQKSSNIEKNRGIC